MAARIKEQILKYLNCRLEGNWRRKRGVKLRSYYWLWGGSHWASSSSTHMTRTMGFRSLNERARPQRVHGKSHRPLRWCPRLPHCNHCIASSLSLSLSLSLSPSCSLTIRVGRELVSCKFGRGRFRPRASKQRIPQNYFKSSKAIS